MSNVFSCVGTLAADAELKHVGHNGTAVLSFRIANNIYDSKTKQNVPLWIRCQLWGSRAEGSLKDYLKKGQQVFVSGELSINEYKANDGTTRTSLELACNTVDLVGGKKTDNNSTPQQTQNSQYDDDIAY